MPLSDSEGTRVAARLGDGKGLLLMADHGVMVLAPTVAQAFDELYYLEKAAEVQVLALATGRPLALVPPDVAALTCAQWHAYPTRFSELHFAELRAILDVEAPDYRG